MLPSRRSICAHSGQEPLPSQASRRATCRVRDSRWNGTYCSGLGFPRSWPVRGWWTRGLRATAWSSLSPSLTFRGVGAGHQSPIANLLWGIAARPVGVTSKPLHIGAHPGTVIPQSSKWATCTVGATVTRVCRAFERFIHQSRCNHACNSAQPRWLAFDAAVGSGLGNLNDSGGN